MMWDGLLRSDDILADRRGNLDGFVLGPGLFRMVLATSVFVSHVSNYEVGRPAVLVFFMLSGFWVVRLFKQEGGDAARFELNRFLRVWPLLAVTSVAVVALTAAFGLAPHGTLASTLTLLGLASRGDDLIGVSWSLDIEAQFYLAVVVVAVIMRRLATRLSMIDALLIVAMVTAVGTALLSRGIWTVAAFAPAFAAGAAIYIRGWEVSARTAQLSVAAFLLLGALFAVTPDLQPLLLKSRSEWWRDVIHMAWCLVLTPFVAWNVRQPSRALDRHLGNLSFPFYLIHPVIIRVVAIGITQALLAHTVALVLAIVSALLLYVLVDRPLEHLRHRLTGKRPTVQPKILVPV